MKIINSLMSPCRSGFLLLYFLFGLSLSGQSQEYKIISADTKAGIGYVNVGILGKNTGTVTDEHGLFSLGFAEVSDTDSLRFSMIGYESGIITAGQLRNDPLKTVILSPRIYELPEMKVVYPRGKVSLLGVPVFSNALRSGFSDNNLGSELGIKVNVKKRTKLLDINFNVGVCTFDSVTYRLNLYRLTDKEEWENILNHPIYISFNKEEIGKAVIFDLKKYSIFVEGETIITLELFREMGEGKLLFLTQFFTGTTWHRKTKEAGWTQSPGQVGIFLHGQALR